MRSENSTLFGGLSATLLWTNPNPNATFGNSRIFLNEIIGKFNYLYIAFKAVNVEGSQVLECMHTFNSGNAYRSSFGIANKNGTGFQRYFTYELAKNEIYISTCYENDAGAVYNDRCIPFKIYGIKGSIQGIK